MNQIYRIRNQSKVFSLFVVPQIWNQFGLFIRDSSTLGLPNWECASKNLLHTICIDKKYATNCEQSVIWCEVYNLASIYFTIAFFNHWNLDNTTLDEYSIRLCWLSHTTINSTEIYIQRINKLIWNFGNDSLIWTGDDSCLCGESKIGNVIHGFPMQIIRNRY